ncbi:VanZ family protein [Pelotomaculum propionicicum]|uniref:VanZ family protein n=1 Tax=Pelotomaculum propionicicum TaxID=258475 RepID=UPI003B76C666
MKKKILWLAILLLWCVAIFIFTEQPVFNDEHSLKIISLLGLSKTATSVIDFIARKLAHAVTFSLLAYLALKAIGNWRWKYPAAWVFTTFCGLADEWHQLQVPGRTGLLQDVIIDSFAAFVLITIVYIWDKRKGRMGC